MNGPSMTRWQRMRTSLFLFSAGVWRRMTFGTRAMLIDGNKILLIKHTYVPGWQFPGGGVEPGETAIASVYREVVEETGYRLTAPPQLHGLYHNARVSLRDHVALYLCHAFEKEREFHPNHEIAECQWFDTAAVPEDATRGTHARIAEVFGGAPADPVW